MGHNTLHVGRYKARKIRSGANPPIVRSCCQQISHLARWRLWFYLTLSSFEFFVSCARKQFVISAFYQLGFTCPSRSHRLAICAFPSLRHSNSHHLVIISIRPWFDIDSLAKPITRVFLVTISIVPRISSSMTSSHVCYDFSKRKRRELHKASCVLCRLPTLNHHSLTN